MQDRVGVLHTPGPAEQAVCERRSYLDVLVVRARLKDSSAMWRVQQSRDEVWSVAWSWSAEKG